MENEKSEKVKIIDRYPNVQASSDVKGVGFYWPAPGEVEGRTWREVFTDNLRLYQISVSERGKSGGVLSGNKKLADKYRVKLKGKDDDQAVLTFIMNNMPDARKGGSALHTFASKALSEFIRWNAYKAVEKYKKIEEKEEEKDEEIQVEEKEGLIGEEAKGKLDAALDDVKKKQDELDKLNGVLELQNAEISELKEEREKGSEKIDKMNLQIQELANKNSELKKVEDNQDALKEEIAKLKNEVGVLRVAAEYAGEVMGSAEKLGSKNEERVKEYEGEIEKYKERITQLKSSDREVKLAELGDEIVKLQEQVKSVRSAKNDLAEKLTEAHGLADKSEQKSKGMALKATEFQDKCSRLEDKLRDLSNEIKGKEMSNMDLNDRVEGLEKNIRPLVQQLEKIQKTKNFKPGEIDTLVDAAKKFLSGEEEVEKSPLNKFKSFISSGKK